MFHEDFLWRYSRPDDSKTGSEKAKKKESVFERDEVKYLFSVMCTPEEARDYEDFDLDETKDGDVDGSVVSSTMGSEFSGRDGRSAAGDLEEADLQERENALED